VLVDSEESIGYVRIVVWGVIVSLEIIDEKSSSGDV
jgi:hypothetical protein